MKKTILTFAIALISLCSFAQSLSFETLSATPNKASFNQDSTGKWTGYFDAYFGIKGCIYSKQQGSTWTGFVQSESISFTCQSTDDIKIVVQAGLDAVEAYRKKNYPDIK